jgi:GTPase
MSGLQDLIRDVLSNNRTALAKAITLIESSMDKDMDNAAKLLSDVLPRSGNSVRIAVTGTPGAGKSTLIDRLGLFLVEKGYKVAVLAIDPSSTKSGGSILGDKTRMENLARSDYAFIRPSPAQGAAGGVAVKTRETILLCEAAGFDIVIIETMGVGQGELAVHEMVDFFLLLQIAGGGDELQGMKKGIIEMADAIVINKADGENIKNTKRAMQEIKMALHYIPGTTHDVPVLTCSAMENKGIDTIWRTISGIIDNRKAAGSFDRNRSRQNRDWMLNLVRSQIQQIFFSDKEVLQKIKDFEQQVLKEEILPTIASQEIIKIFKERYKS